MIGAVAAVVPYNETQPTRLDPHTICFLSSAPKLVTYYTTVPHVSILFGFQLFEFADKYRGKYDSSITVAQRYYQSVSGYAVNVTSHLCKYLLINIVGLSRL